MTLDPSEILAPENVLRVLAKIKNTETRTALRNSVDNPHVTDDYKASLISRYDLVPEPIGGGRIIDPTWDVDSKVDLQAELSGLGVDNIPTTWSMPLEDRMRRVEAIIDSQPNWFNYRKFFNDVLGYFKRKGTTITALEVGAFFGASTIYLATRLMDHDDESRLWVVDHCRGEESTDPKGWYRELSGGNYATHLLRNIWDADVEDRVIPVLCDFKTFGRSMLRMGVLNAFNLLFIDGSHDQDDVEEDIELAKQLAIYTTDLQEKFPKGTRTVIAGHDFTEGHQGVIAAVKVAFPEAAEYDWRAIRDAEGGYDASCWSVLY